MKAKIWHGSPGFAQVEFYTDVGANVGSIALHMGSVLEPNIEDEEYRSYIEARVSTIIPLAQALDTVNSLLDNDEFTGESQE